MVALKIIYAYVIPHLSTTKKDDELTCDGWNWISTLKVFLSFQVCATEMAS